MVNILKYENNDSSTTYYYVNGKSVSKKEYEKEALKKGIRIYNDKFDAAYERKKENSL